MAIDPGMVDSLLSAFRDMLAATHAMGATGADVEEMAATLAEMETLGRQLSDLGEYSTRLASDGYYQRFTDAYTRAMLAAAGAGGAGGAGAVPDDAALLTQSLNAYEGALERLRMMPDQAPAISAIERILVIGRSGVTYPVFLTQLENENLADALAGSVTPTRRQLLDALTQLQQLVDPARAAEAAAVLAAHDELAADSPTGVVDPFAFELRRFEIVWQYAPRIARRDAAVPRVGRLLDLVIDWLDAHTSWAARDQRFQADDATSTARKIAMIRDCNPGLYAVRAEQFTQMFGPEPWWTHPVLDQERSAGRILWSEPRIRLALDAVPACVPLASAPVDLVARAEAFGPDAF